jgi:CheY-like chemotaxis protein
MKVDQTSPLYRDLNQIRLAAGRAASLTRQLLLFSRRQPMELTPCNLNSIFEDLLKMLRRLIGEDITINTDLKADLWTILADAGNIEQVIMNLAVNARDAMTDGGKITIKTENVRLDEEYCKTYTYARPGTFVCLSVEDTGIGMDRETIQHIFEPFFTTKETGKGTGLGLSVVYGIIKQHEGWINVYSEPGQGTTFKIYLPASPVKHEDEKKEKISLEGLQGNGERILLVEDEEPVRNLVARAMSKNGYVVTVARNAEEAMDIFEKEGRNFHLVFTDVVLPNKSGLQLIDHLLSRKPELPVLLSSGYTDQKSQWSIIQKRKYRFLQKPYTIPDLLKIIREILEQAK